MILSALPLEQSRILGYTDLGEVAYAPPPASDRSKGKLYLWDALCTHLVNVLAGVTEAVALLNSNPDSSPPAP